METTERPGECGWAEMPGMIGVSAGGEHCPPKVRAADDGAHAGFLPPFLGSVLLSASQPTPGDRYDP